MKTVKDCACVIHGDAYDWIYVERLYNMLKANSNHDIRLHVFTESSRMVPEPFIKHELTEWPGVAGPKKSWWYKMQMFNPKHNLGRVLYMDLDIVITRNIDWIWETNDQYFWAVKDFIHLWRPSWTGINSSVMLWNNAAFDWVWENFSNQNIAATVKLYRGDQDYITRILDQRVVRFFDTRLIKSWRWECFDGGMDFKTRLYRNPDTGTTLDKDTAIMVFHGKPKPQDVLDSVVEKYWKML